MAFESPLPNKSSGVLRAEKLRKYIQSVERKSKPSFNKTFPTQRKTKSLPGTRTVYLDPRDPVDRTTIQIERTMNDHARRGRPENVWGSTLKWYDQFGKPKPRVIYKIKGQK